MKIKKVLIVTAMFVLTACLLSCSEPEKGAAKELSQAVIITKPAKKSFASSFETVSVAEAYKKAFIIPKVSANIVKFLAGEGDFVKKGQPLVRLDRRDYSIAVEAAEAQISAAEAGALQARVTYDKVLADYERLKKLRQKDSISQSEYEEIETALKQSEAAVSVAEAQERATRSNLKSAKRQLSYTTLYAPFSGYISMRNGETGEMASPQNPMPMFEIVQSHQLKIDVF
ncbi:MAG: efflux RND transporter periplasmic adaptor subunit, partial [bacterium]